MNIKYNILVGLCSCSLLLTQTSCEDFLDKSPDMGLTEDDVYKDYFSMRGYLDRAFNFLENATGWNTTGNGLVASGAISDEFAIVCNGATQAFGIHSGNWLNKEIGGYEIGNGSGTVIGKSYSAIRIVNRVINDIDRVKQITPEQKDELVGQARFLRAWFYFQLIKRYGGMPKLDKLYVGDGDEDLPRMTYHESHDWMMEDLEAAITMLPDAWDDNNTGRPNKIAAMALKSMAQLYDASPLMQNGLDKIEVLPYDKDRLVLAAKSAQQAIDYMLAHPETDNYLMSGPDHPEEEYKNIFYFTNPPYMIPEYIWYNRSGVNDATRAINGLWLPMQYTNKTGNEAAAINAPTQNMVDMYEKKGDDGNYYPISDPKAGYSDEEPYKARDPRFYNNILYSGVKWGANKSGQALYITSYVGGKIYEDFLKNQFVNKRTFSGYMCKKFIWEDANAFQTQYRKYWFLHVYIRVAQLYLDLAEASFEATGSATAKVEGCSLSALDALNVIRRRAGITDIVADIYNDADKFREAVRRERAVELMFENNNRWFDLRRWMIAHEVFAGNYPIKGMKAYPLNPNHAKVPDKSTLKFRYERFDVETEQRRFEMRNYWYPFAMNDVAAMKNLKQNPGW